MDGIVIEILKVLGVPGLVTWCFYRLLDKWAAKGIEVMVRSLEVNNKQATALADLADTVKQSQTSQLDVLTAVRVLATKVDDVLGYMREQQQTELTRDVQRERRS